MVGYRTYDDILKEQQVFNMQIRYYKTELQGAGQDRFKMLSDLLANDKMVDHLKPRILHLVDRQSDGGYLYLSAIVVWE